MKALKDELFSLQDLSNLNYLITEIYITENKHKLKHNRLVRGKVKNMVQAILKQSLISDKLFFRPPVNATYLWKNLITEKRTSINWLRKLYKGSAFYDFWLIISAPVD